MTTKSHAKFALRARALCARTNATDCTCENLTKLLKGFQKRERSILLR